MTAREQGFLLLTGHLGNPERKPLTIPQLRDLTLRMQGLKKPGEDRALTVRDLLQIGCSREGAERIVTLLSQQEQLEWYLNRGKAHGCYPITRVSEAYPARLRKTLGPEAPGALWCLGDSRLLEGPGISVVGSRELREENAEFAWEAGKQAALQGYALISGNARGADRAAQEGCLSYGGNVICIVADVLAEHRAQENILFLSEDGYDLPFSSQRALQRNRIIHALGEKVFVAQSRLGTGGTWNGTQKNLVKQWSPVFCFRDGSEAARELQQLGATAVTTEALSDICSLLPDSVPFIEN